MTGLFLIAVAIAWLAAVVVLTRWVTRRFRSTASKFVSGLVVFPVLLAAPLTDELIGKRQFDLLCKKYAVVVIDEQHAMNRRVVTTIRQEDRFAQGTAVRIRIDPYTYRDTETNQVLVSYHTLHAEGGWLIRVLGISETNGPLLFHSGCAPDDRYAFKKKFNITVVN